MPENFSPHSYRCARCGGNGYLMRIHDKAMVKCDGCEGAGTTERTKNDLGAEIKAALERHDGPGMPSINVEGRDFYELCQAYRWSKERPVYSGSPSTVQAFEALKEYIKTGALPWESYERTDATESEGSK